MNTKDTNFIKTRYMILASVISALLTIAAFPPLGFSFLVWFSLCPWLCTIPFQSTTQIFCSYLIFQGMLFVLGTSWLGAVHIVCPFAMAIAVYTVTVPFPFLLRWCFHKNTMATPYLLTLLWVAVEFIRSFIFTGFPYLSLGHSQAFDCPNLIQIADITGVHGVSFIIIFTNTSIIYFTWLCYKYWQKDMVMVQQHYRFVSLHVAIAICLIIGCVGYGKYRVSHISYEQGPRIVSIQGNIPQDIKDSAAVSSQAILDSYLYHTLEFLKKDHADMLIWPETMVPEDLYNSPGVYMLLRDFLQHAQIPMLAGSHCFSYDYTKQEYYIRNSAYFVSPEVIKLEQYDKIHLVPVGEFVPFRNMFPFLPIIIQNLAGFIPNLLPGTQRPVFRLKEYSFGTVICYDIAYSEDARELRKKNCQFIVNITNEGWFMHTSELEQLLQISIFRAIENRIGIVRSGNTGITLTIPPTGIILPENTLIMPLSEYWSSLPNHLQERWKNQKSIAWQHVPECFWRNDSPMYASVAQKWDFLYKDIPYKWKDFGGYFCQNVPLCTQTTTFYTEYGDIFAWTLIGILVISFARILYISRQKVS